MNYQVSNKRKLLNIKFGAQRDRWNNTIDDRELFCIIYDNLLDSLNDMEVIHNPLIWVAYNNEFTKQCKILTNISDRFEK